jgi:hypothetical protein
LRNITKALTARRRCDATKDVVNENRRISILATAGLIGIARHPIVVGPVEANPAKLELAFHPAQLRVGDRLDHVLQVAIDPPQCGPHVDANAFSTRPAKPISARLVALVAKIRSIIVVMKQIAIFFIADQEVGYLASPPSAQLASYWSEDADDGIGNRGARPLSLIAAA